VALVIGRLQTSVAATDLHPLDSQIMIANKTRHEAGGGCWLLLVGSVGDIMVSIAYTTPMASATDTTCTPAHRDLESGSKPSSTPWYIQPYAR